MKELTKRERAAIDAVAAKFSGTWDSIGDRPEPWLSVDGKRVAVDVRTLKGAPEQAQATRVRLRFDKVVTRLMEGLRARLDNTVPAGVTVLLTVTAPIRLPAKTEASLDAKIKALFTIVAANDDEQGVIHGNHIRIRLWRGGSSQSPKLIGFVHNPDSDPLPLLEMSGEWLDEMIRAQTGRRASVVAARWLIVISRRRSGCLVAYRSIHSQLPMETGYERVLVVFEDGRVEELSE